MARVLLTGMSGTGKSTVLAELSRRGIATVDTDIDGWTLPDGTWDERRMDELLARGSALVVSGTVENQGRFYDRFDHVVLLSAPLPVLLERIRERVDNLYGKRAGQQAEIERNLVIVEPLLRAGADLELDTSCRSVAEIADRLEELVGRDPAGRRSGLRFEE